MLPIGSVQQRGQGHRDDQESTCDPEMFQGLPDHLAIRHRLVSAIGLMSAGAERNI